MTSRYTATGSYRRQAHIDWLKLVEVSGPFLSVPVLSAEWPDLESVDISTCDRLRQEHRAWQESPVKRRDEWIDFVLHDLLGWRDATCRDDMDRHALSEPLHDTTIIPAFSLIDPATGTIRLLGMVSDGSPVARIKGSDWAATPADRLVRLCRHHGTELGLATDGRWWALVWAPPEEVTTVAVFDAMSWPDSSERTVVRAFISLLERRRFFAVPPSRQLPALLRESVRHQEDLTEQLGVQVRQAVELLVAAFARAGIPTTVTAADVYRGAVAVMMRTVFLLFAEESGLLPADNELYARSYSAGGLYAELEQQVAYSRGNEAELDHTFLAWHRLLALFTVIYRGVAHPDLELIAHDGSLFDPDVHQWFPLTVDDRTVLHMLRAVQTVTIAGELRAVSFRTLTVEQIGYIYEGLLSFECFRAVEIVVGLIGREGRGEEVLLRRLESLAARHADLPANLATEFKDSGIGTMRSLEAKLTPLNFEERIQAETRLYAVAQDPVLVQRLLPFYRIIRQDLRGDPVVILPGALYISKSALRASTGAHYTPRFLAEQVAEGALEPLLYYRGPLQTADRSEWKLRTAEEILALRVADIAMGSGAFLVAACRYLAGKLIEAWSAEGNVDAQAHTESLAEPSLVLDVTTDPLVIRARREIIKHCLYGVDINPTAVEIAKLSLWLVSMDPDRPFTFVDDRLVPGDSLLGITSIDQLKWMHLDISAGRNLHEDTLLDYREGIRSRLKEISREREHIVRIPDDDIADVDKKREVLTGAQVKTEGLIHYANLITGAAFASSRKQAPWLTVAEIIQEAVADDVIQRAKEQGKKWLATDQPDGAFDRQPLHWPLAFPEVFDENRSFGPGFDAIIGNPPFLGGQKLTGSLGTAYREFLVNWIGHGVRGSADLIAYFLLRAHALLNQHGQTGLIATNTLTQGDTREVGLDQIVAAGTEIRQAVKSKPWPSKSAALEYSAIWTSQHPIASSAIRLSDGIPVNRIAPSLDPSSRVSGNPERLIANSAISFQGAIVLGMGFIMEPEQAQALISKNPRNADVLFPYLNGQDLNSRPDCSASRWVIDFKSLPEGQAKAYSEPYSLVLQEVRPERIRNNRKVYRDYWWQYAEKRPALTKAIKEFELVIAIARISKTVMPVMISTGQVMNEKTIVFASDDTGLLALLSCAPHYWWAIQFSSTMKADLNYAPSDVFETFPCPEATVRMRELGRQLNSFRRELMLARWAGLTATYNLVHDRNCTDADIAGLREIHRAIDDAVMRAYGWDDLLAAGLDHGFHETRQGPRYTIGPVVRQEILDRLLELNHERYAAEVAVGLHDKKIKKRAIRDASGDGTLF
jgi:hypothetical protein